MVHRVLTTAGCLSTLSLAAWLLAARPALAQNTWSAIEPGSSNWSGPPPALPRRTTPPPRPTGLKSEGQPLSGVLPQLLRVQPWQFEFLPGQGGEGTHYGLRPGSLARAFPNLVKTDLRTGVQTVTTAELLPLLLAAIQEQQGQIRLLQEQQLQLAQAYADLATQRPARRPAPRPPDAAPPGPLARVFRPRRPAPVLAPDSVLPAPLTLPSN